jgi:DNA-directed RNA polymerase subunit RPC12/RpoP
MATNKTVYKCNDCIVSFDIRRINIDRVKIHCPFCGDWVNVRQKGRRDIPWTTQEVERLLDLEKQGYKRMVIAAKLGRTYEGVNKKLRAVKKEQKERLAQCQDQQTRR